MHYFSDLFGKVLYMFRTGPMSIIRSISTLNMQQVFVMLVLLASASVVLAYCEYTVFRYSWWWTLDLSETCRVLYHINLRNSASRWLLLWEYISKGYSWKQGYFVLSTNKFLTTHTHTNYDSHVSWQEKETKAFLTLTISRHNSGFTPLIKCFSAHNKCSHNFHDNTSTWISYSSENMVMKFDIWTS